jgi:DNA-binding NtrC family response regulator
VFLTGIRGRWDNFPSSVGFFMSNSASPLRVLVIEDETLIRWSIAETLAQEGHSVLEAGDARSAVEALTDPQEQIDVVLLDFRLPDSNDLGLLANVRRLQPESAVVMMTAFGTPEVTREALEMGAFGVVNKPFDIHGLGSLVRAAYGSRLDRSA